MCLNYDPTLAIRQSVCYISIASQSSGRLSVYMWQVPLFFYPLFFPRTEKMQLHQLQETKFIRDDYDKYKSKQKLIFFFTRKFGLLFQMYMLSMLSKLVFFDSYKKISCLCLTNVWFTRKYVSFKGSRICYKKSYFW